MRNRPIYKIGAILLSIVLIACGSGSTTDDTDKINVLATTPMLGDFVNQIGGENINLTILMPLEADPRFSMFTATISVGVLLLFTTGGLLNFLTKIVQDITQSNVLGIILLGLFIVLIDEIIGIPLAIYSTFTLEEKYGFNKTTAKTFVQDLIKNLIISVVFASTLYAVVISIIERLGDNWWIYAFVAVFLFQAIVFYLYPVLILPLFNKLEPITDEKFKEPIEKLLNKINFKAKGLFVMDGSLRSSHGNAFFTGFGNNIGSY